MINKKSSRLYKSLVSMILVISMILQLGSPCLADGQTSNSGKSLISQGKQEFKSSFEGTFSPEWFLTKFGIQMGYHLIDCAIEKKSPDVKAVAKSMLTADYLASTAGGMLGYASGCFLTPVLSKVPIVGGLLKEFVPILTAYLGGSLASDSLASAKNGKFSIKEVFKGLDWPKLIAGSIGWTAGSLLCGAILPPIGGIIGSIVGDFVMGKVVDMWRERKGKLDVPPTPTGGNTAGPITGPIGVGNSGGDSSSGPKASSASFSETTNTFAEQPIASTFSALQERYQKLYASYSELLAAGKQLEAVGVAARMKEIRLELQKLK
jgi:hypothetical protein